MEVKMQNVEQQVRDLSGGNKQKVVIAKWLANDSAFSSWIAPPAVSTWASKPKFTG